jgi:hypothetical protein
MTTQETCPLCGTPVRVVGSDEGTQHYEPTTPPAPGLREALKRARNDLLAYGRHNDGEWVHKHADRDHRPVGEPCRCGLDAAIAYASAAVGEQPQSHRERVALDRRALASESSPLGPK